MVEKCNRDDCTGEEVLSRPDCEENWLIRAHFALRKGQLAVHSFSTAKDHVWRTERSRLEVAVHRQFCLSI